MGCLQVSHSTASPSFSPSSSSSHCKKWVAVPGGLIACTSKHPWLRHLLFYSHRQQDYSHASESCDHRKIDVGYTNWRKCYFFSSISSPLYSTLPLLLTVCYSPDMLPATSCIPKLFLTDLSKMFASSHREVDSCTWRNCLYIAPTHISSGWMRPWVIMLVRFPDTDVMRCDVVWCGVWGTGKMRNKDVRGKE